jgi:endonuclease V-like protein UPF0215 family
MKNKTLENKKFWTIKKEIRILGIDDGPFKPHSKEQVLIVGAMFRAGAWLDGLLSTKIQVDGNDSTLKIIKMVNKSRHKSQLGVIMLDGLTFGGFNVVNVQEVFLKTGIPVMVIMRKYPSLEKIKKALKRFPDWELRWEAIQDAGEIFPIENKENIFMQIKGISRDDAEKIVKLSTTRSAIPEPIRAAHIIASGIVNGESRGSA